MSTQLNLLSFTLCQFSQAPSFLCDAACAILLSSSDCLTSWITLSHWEVFFQLLVYLLQLFQHSFCAFLCLFGLLVLLPWYLNLMTLWGLWEPGLCLLCTLLQLMIVAGWAWLICCTGPCITCLVVLLAILTDGDSLFFLSVLPCLLVCYRSAMATVGMVAVQTDSTMF